jgi:hypothetical protein
MAAIVARSEELIIANGLPRMLKLLIEWSAFGIKVWPAFN